MFYDPLHKPIKMLICYKFQQNIEKYCKVYHKNFIEYCKYRNTEKNILHVHVYGSCCHHPSPSAIIFNFAKFYKLKFLNLKILTTYYDIAVLQPPYIIIYLYIMFLQEVNISFLIKSFYLCQGCTGQHDLSNTSDPFDTKCIVSCLYS